MKRWPKLQAEKESVWMMRNGNRPSSDFIRSEIDGFPIYPDKTTDTITVLCVPEDEDQEQTLLAQE